MKSESRIEDFAELALWRNSQFCVAIKEELPSFQLLTILHGERVDTISLGDTSRYKLDQGVGHDPAEAFTSLKLLLLRDFSGCTLKRVFLVSDERGIALENTYKCSDGFPHSDWEVSDSGDPTEFFFGNIEPRHILSLYPSPSRKCDFSRPLAAILGAFDGEGFVLLRR